MSTKKIFLVTLLILIFAVVGIGLFRFFQPSKSYEKSNPDYLLTANQLVGAFSENETLANEKYLDAVIQIKDTVVSITKGSQGIVLISFIDPLLGVTCAFNNLKPEDLNQIGIGNEISIKGRCDGKLTDVRLSKCFLVKE